MLELIIWGLIGIVGHFLFKITRAKKKYGKGFHFINFITDHVYNIFTSLVIVVAIAMHPIATWDFFIAVLNKLNLLAINIDYCLFTTIPPSLFVVGYMGDSIMRKIIQAVKSILSKIKKNKK